MRLPSPLGSVLFLSALLFVGRSVAGEEREAAFAMSIEEFRQLSESDRKSLLLSAFEHRLQHAKNIQYEALMLIRTHELKDGTPAEVFQHLNGSRLKHWVLGDSFRMDTIRGGPDVSNPEQFVVCGLDSNSGIHRSTVRYSERDRMFGRIGVEIDRIIYSNRYAYWLDGERNANTVADYLFRYLVDHQDAYTVEVPFGQHKVSLTVPWNPYGSSGTRLFELDSERGFLPVRGKGRWELKRERRSTTWRSEQFFVEDAQLVRDVWMPTRLKEIVRSSTLDNALGEGKANVYDITVSQIEAGTVTTNDLKVPFAPGMEIVDAIKGEAFVVGSDGERTGVESVVGAAVSLPSTDGLQEPDQESTASSRSAWIVINIGALALVAAAVVLRRLLKNPRP